MAKNLQNILIVSAATLGSRVLGLLRDILMMGFLGLSSASSAFIFAFTVPNLFRRLLGEGALSSALIPVFSESLKNEGRTPALAFANRVLSRSLVVLFLLTGLGIFLFCISWLLVRYAGLADVFSGDQTQWEKGCEMGIILLPYMILVCLAALMGALLNVLQRFAIHALTAVWLNLAIVAALLIGGLAFGLKDFQLGIALCFGVLVGGLVQVAVPIVTLWREGWETRLDFSPSPQLAELWRIFLPAVAGAAVIQVNILVSRVLAFGLNETGVTALYLANRLVELPLGVFAISVATVAFPNLSLLASSNDHAGLSRVYGEGVRLILAVTIPAAVGLAILADPVLGLLFEWGRFSALDVEKTTPILVVFSLALPFYGLATIATRGFHAVKDTRTPVRVAVVSFVVNLILSVALMFPFGTLGLALANLASAGVQALMLAAMLPKVWPAYAGSRYFKALSKIGVAATLMAATTWALWLVIQHQGFEAKLGDTLAVVVVIPLCAVLYFAVLWCLRYEDRQDLLNLILRLGRSK